MKHELFPSSENIEEPASLDRPPSCRAAWGAGRPAAGRLALQGPERNFFTKIFTDKPLLRGGRPYFLQFSPFREIISHMCSFYNFLQK